MEVLVLLVIGGAIAAFVMLRRGEVVRFETTAVQQQVIMAAVGILASKRRWNTLSQSESSANFTYQRGANKLLLVFLLLFFIVPGIVYWVLSGRKEAVAITTEATGPSMTVVQISSNGWRGKSAGRALRSQVGLAPASVASVAPTQTPGQLDPVPTAGGEQGPAGTSDATQGNLPPR